MAHDLPVKVERGHLVPLMSAGAELLDSLDGQEYRCVLTVAKGRSYPQLKLYFAMCGLVADNYESDATTMTKDIVDQFLRIETGHCTVVGFPDGSYRMFPKSIAFDKMEPDDFNAFIDRAMNVVAAKFGPELGDAVRTELYRMMDGEGKA